jgi:hypothetical protein
MREELVTKDKMSGNLKRYESVFSPPLNIKYIFDRFPRRARVFQFCNANLVKIIELTKLSVLRFVKATLFFYCSSTGCLSVFKTIDE